MARSKIGGRKERRNKNALTDNHKSGSARILQENWAGACLEGGKEKKCVQKRAWRMANKSA